MGVDIESFEKWYANQVKHKKITGKAPGEELLKKSYSVHDVANLLGIHDSNVYEFEIIDQQGLPDVVFHSLQHTSVTYKLKLSGGDIKSVQGDSGHA